MTRDQGAWRNPRVFGTLLLIFFAGAASGALWMRLDLHERLHRTVSASSSLLASRGTPAARDAGRDAVVQNFKAKLDLSLEQTQQIAAVLADYRQYYDSLEDQLEDLRATGKSRVLQVLNPEQREKFQKMMADLAPQFQPAAR